MLGEALGPGPPARGLFCPPTWGAVGTARGWRRPSSRSHSSSSFHSFPGIHFAYHEAHSCDVCSSVACSRVPEWCDTPHCSVRVSSPLREESPHYQSFLRPAPRSPTRGNQQTRWAFLWVCPPPPGHTCRRAQSRGSVIDFFLQHNLFKVNCCGLFLVSSLIIGQAAFLS